MKKNLKLLIIFLFLINSILFASQKEKISFTNEEINYIEKNPSVKIGFSSDIEPLLIKRGNTYKGVLPKFYDLLSKESGLKFEIVDGKLSSLYKKAQNGEIDGVMFFPGNSSDNYDLIYSESIFNFIFKAFAKESENIRINSFEDLKKYKIVYYKEAPHIKSFLENKGLNLIQVETIQDTFKMILNKQADILIGSSFSNYVIDKNSYLDIEQIHTFKEDYDVKASMALNKDKTLLLGIINKSISNIKNNKVDEIIDSWIEHDLTKESINQNFLTKEEKNWIQENPNVNIIEFFEEAPYTINTSIKSGFTYEFLEEIVSSVGLKTNYISGYKSYETMIKDLDEHKVDILSTIPNSLNLDAYKNVEKSKPYLRTPFVIVGDKDDFLIHDIKELYGKKVAVVKGYIQEVYLKKHPEIQIYYVANNEEGFEAIFDGDVDYYINNKDNTNYILKTKYNSQLKILHELAFKEFPALSLSFGVNKNNKTFNKILKKSLENISSKKLRKIKSKWIEDYYKNLKVNLTKEEIEYLKNKKVIKVHNEISSEPFNFNKFNQEAGYSVELMKLVAKNTGLNLEFVVGPSWNEFLEMLKNNELDVMLNVVKNQKREEYLSFTDSYLSVPMGMAVHADNKSIKTFEQALDKNIALEKGFFYHDYILKYYPNTKLTVLDNGGQALQHVSLNKVDLALGILPAMKYIANRNFIDNLKFIQDIDFNILQNMELHFATNKNDKLLNSILQKGLASITIQEHNELKKVWLESYDLTQGEQVGLTKKEKKWLKEQEKINIGVINNNAPLSYINDDKLIGFDVDFLDLLNKRLGGKLNYLSGEFNKHYEDLQNKNLDALIGVKKTKPREKEFFLTSEYVNIPHYIITKDNVKNIYSDINELKGKTLALEKRYLKIKNLQKYLKGIKIQFYDTSEEAILAVSDAKAYAYIGNHSVIKYNLEKNFITNIKLHTKSIRSQTNLTIAINKDKEILRDILQKTILSITSEEKSKLYDKYINFGSKNVVQLTQKEQLWLDKKIPIRYAYDSSWQPFEWTDEFKEHNGIIYDILKLVSDRTGLVFEPVLTKNWAEAVDLAKDKKVDMISSGIVTKERKKYFKYTENHIFKTPYVFVTNEKNKKDYIYGFDSFSENETLVLVKDYAFNDFITQLYPNIKIKYVASLKEGFEVISQNKAEVMFVNASSAKYHINRKNFDNIKVATTTPYDLKLKPAIRNDWPDEVLSIIDKGLASLSQKEISEIYRYWTQPKKDEIIDWEIVIYISASVLLIFLMILYWNRKLKIAVDQKTKELQSLLKAFDSNVIASTVDLNGKITYASKAFCSASGYLENELVGKHFMFLLPSSDAYNYIQNIWNTVNERKTWKGEIKTKKKDGSFYWAYLTIKPQFDDKNQIINFSFIRHDITAKKEFEELNKNLENIVKERTLKLEESQKKFSTLFDLAPDSILILKDFKVVQCNYKAVELYGLNSKEELLGLNHIKDFSLKYQDSGHSSIFLAKKHIKEAKEKGFKQFEWKDKKANGEIFESEITLAPLIIENEEHLYLVIRDISERKQALQKIEEQNNYINSVMNSQSNIVITTNGKKLRTVNKAFLNFFEVENEEEFKSSYGDCICETFIKKPSKKFIQKLMNNEQWTEYIHNRPNEIHKVEIEKNKQIHTFTITSDRFEFADEVLNVAVFTDITELERSKKNIEAVFENMMIPVLIASAKSRKFVYVNEEASCLFEKDVEEFIGENINFILTSKEQKNKISNLLKQNGEINSLEDTFTTKDGKEFIGLFSLKLIEYNGEKAYLGMIVDITEQKRNEQKISQLHRNTQSSIEYASMIQHSLVPKEETLIRYFDDAFAIWQPKDIVGGDIFLFETFRDDNECLLMVIDCTGHGVPGAFVTMLVKAIETQIITTILNDEKMQVSPAWILKYFNQTIKKLLNQENNNSTSNVGFDGAILYYNKKENIIKYAGSMIPLIYTKKGDFNIIKGDRHSVGYKKSNQNYEFKEHLVHVEEEMQVYLSTDGFLDQNGGENSFPFGKTRFINILDKNKHLDSYKQKTLLLEELKEYQKDEITNDDIAVVGIKTSKNN